jgi:proline-specific peptidase
MLPVSSSESHKTTNASNSNTAKLVEDYPYLLDPQYYATIELPKILEELGLDTNGYHIVGNSWGTILAQYFVLNTDAKGLKSLTLSGPLSDGDLYVDSQWSEAGYNNLGQLPPYVKHRIAVLEAEGAYESEEYQLIDDVLTGKFTVRTQPAPDCWWACFDGINREVYVGLQGPSEFTFGGVLGGFSTTERLHTITVPVALTSGAYDTMRPPVVDVMYREIPKAEWTILEHSGHVTMIDDAGWTNDVVNDFLTRVEAASNSPEGPASFEPLPDKCGPEGCVPKGVPLTDVGGAATVEGDFSMGVVLWVGIVSFCMGVLASECLGLASGGRRSAGYQSL